MSALHIADLPLAQYKNQIAKSSVADGDVLEEEGKIFFITALCTRTLGASIVFISLNGEEQSFSPRYWTGYYTHHFQNPLCGRRFSFTRISSFHGFYAASGGSI